MDEWPKHRVDYLQGAGILFVEDGNHGEYRPRQNEFQAHGTAFIRAADMDAGQIHFKNAQKINDVALKRIRKGFGRGGDVLFSHKGTVGKLALAPEDAPPFVCSPQTTFWRVMNEERLDRRFLYYYMQSEEFTNQWNARKAETDMADYVSLTSQRELTVALPNIVVQRSIGKVLGALDDKIELNRRMNRTLEHMAAALFKSWFVDFDPVVAKAAGHKPYGMDEATAALFPDSFQDSDLGPIPIGWRAGGLGEVAENIRRGAQQSEFNSTIAYIGLEHMPRRSIALSDWDQAEDLMSNKFRFAAGQILFGKLRPYFHKVGVAPLDGVCSTDILVVMPRELAWFGFVLGHISSTDIIAYADATSAGTKMPRVSWQDLAKYQVVLPTHDVTAVFTNEVKPLVGRILRNIHESRALRLHRDELLPQVMSGEIRLADAEKQAANVL